MTGDDAIAESYYSTANKFSTIYKATVLEIKQLFFI
jgi:hypothetical protein